jgi:membrane dipeptidase
MPRLIVDSHLDLAWSALFFNRDLLLEVDQVRKLEEGMTDEKSRGHNTLTFLELKRAGVRIAVGTLLARGGPVQPVRPLIKRSDLDYVNQTHAYCIAHSQLAYYHVLEKQGVIKMLRTARDLDAHHKLVTKDDSAPMGMILSMEGADPIMSPAQVQEWWDNGLRACGPSHYGRSHYSYGTGVEGPFSPAGKELLKAFERVGMILDVTHLCDESMAQAFDLFGGRMLASHHNCRALVPGDRQLTDDQIKTLVKRNAVIGAALDAWMLYPGWVRMQTKPEVVGLTAVADHIDHVCQLAGNVKHSAIGSDLDGGFGYEQTPRDFNKITDLQKLAGILSERNYSDADINLIFHGNWLRFFKEALPA